MTTSAVRLENALAGRYRIERELGEGGMATVYLAHDFKHHRKALGWPITDALQSMPEHRAMLKAIGLPGAMHD